MSQLTITFPSCGYFISGQPWTKFCSQCALSLALYGKKIDKDLSTLELGNKNQILTIVERIKNQLKKVEESKNPLINFIIKLENIEKSQISEIVYQFNSYINNLCELRNQIMEIFESSFTQSLQTFLERQTKIFLCETELKNNLEYIEMYFKKLVQSKENNQLEAKIEEWNTILANINHLLPKNNEEEELNQFINERITLIKSKIINIEPFVNTISEEKRNYLIDIKSVQGTGKKTLQTSIFDDDVKENLKKNPTQLKLRSKSKKRERNGEKESQSLSVRAKKVIKEISNFQNLEAFQV